MTLPYRLVLGVCLALAAGCSLLFPPPVEQLRVPLEEVDPPLTAILSRVATYAHADDSEDPRIFPTAQRLAQELLEGPQSILATKLAPLANGGLLLVYYESQTQADPLLTPEQREGRSLAAEMLGEALSRLLTR